jgi:hypothetical protein
MQALRIRVARIFLASALLVGAAAPLDAQEAEGRRSSARRREMSVALEPARAPLLPRIVAGALLLFVVLGAIGRRRARTEIGAGSLGDRDGPT